MSNLTVGQLAKATGVRAATIRYYEEVGVLPAARRTAAGYRQYTAAGVQQVGFVRRARAIGLSLEQVKTLTAAIKNGVARARLLELVRVQLDAVEQRMAELRELKADLQRIQRQLHTRRARPDGAACRCLETNGTGR